MFFACLCFPFLLLSCTSKSVVIFCPELSCMGTLLRRATPCSDGRNRFCSLFLFLSSLLLPFSLNRSFARDRIPGVRLDTSFSPFHVSPFIFWQRNNFCLCALRQKCWCVSFFVRGTWLHCRAGDTRGFQRPPDLTLLRTCSSAWGFVIPASKFTMLRTCSLLVCVSRSFC